MSSSWVFVAQIGSEIVNEDSYFALTTSRLAVVILSVTKAIAGWNLKSPSSTSMLSQTFKDYAHEG